MYANLSKARLTGANLLGANLKKANLEGANLKGAHLRGTDLREDVLSDLLGPKFREKVILQDAKGLTQDQIEQAVVDHDTTVPKGIEHPIITLARGVHGPSSTRKRDN
jgi:uncharacterized protein YjbI with pentapeptide repeats